MNCLAAYQINEEKTGNGLRTFEQSCMLKLADLVSRLSLDIEELFELI